MPRYLVTVSHRHEPGAPEQLYLLEGDLTDLEVQQLARELLHDPVVQHVQTQQLDDPGVGDSPGVEVAYKPGVTDNEAESIRAGAQRMGIGGLRVVRTLRRYGAGDGTVPADRYNPLIQLCFVPPDDSPAARSAFYETLLRPSVEAPPQVRHILLRESVDDELLRISREGILSLDLAEMRAIQAYFRSAGRDPTDGELETLAQTWSEHCSHKTFKARVRYRCQPAAGGESVAAVDPLLYPSLHMLSRDCEIDSLIGTFLIAATNVVLARKLQQSSGRDEPASVTSFSVLSAFVDNAGIVAFGADHELSFKVETHNHPSALEPFGGANTGVGGVVRDVLGVSAQPIANTDVLCFGPLDLPLRDGPLHPRVIASGVVAGIRDYGNKLGIPTVNGAVLYDPGYIANPLVYCGTLGLAPRGRHPRNVEAGDVVVVLGGRTGRDGIHGATFSSVELAHTTAEEVGSAVQIGDPITEKKLIDVVLQARDQALYSAITDCGAGGLSSAVGEMGAETGVQVALEHVPLKYSGLQPWEIWLSEAQERMVVAVPPDHLDALLGLCAAEDVEATPLGRFTGDGRLTVTYRDLTLVDFSMDFLHNGMPQRVLDAVWAPPDADLPTIQHPEPVLSDVEGTNIQHSTSTLLALLAHPNIASKAPIVRTYDHEVGGRTIVKPLVGKWCDGPGDAAVLQPLRTSLEGVAIGCGINPRYGQVDPYWMALASVDEALRNVVAAGGDPAQAAILDNFCWGDPRQPDRMAGLVRAAAGCYDSAVAYGTPYISGKDSLNNEYRAADGARIPIPPTLLISAIARVPDVRHAITMDLKEPGNLVYLVGITKPELGGAHLIDVASPVEGSSAEFLVAINPTSNLPRVDLAVAPRLLTAVHAAIRAGLVRACHDLSEGGLAVAAAEMALAGGLGLALDLRAAPRSNDAQADTVLLFAESPTRLLVEVQPADAAAFEALMSSLPHAVVGRVTGDANLSVTGLIGREVLRATVAELKAAWQGTRVV
jgi:phosphoribosylformylglycinamidine synthase